MAKLKWIVLALILLVVVALGFWISSENSQLVSPTLLGFSLWQLNLGAWLFLVFLLGGFVGYLVSWISLFRLKSRNRTIEKKLGQKDREISRLRSTSVGS